MYLTQGGIKMEVIFYIIVYGSIIILGLQFVYLIIERGVRHGINNSIIGHYLAKKMEEETQAEREEEQK